MMNEMCVWLVKSKGKTPFTHWFSGYFEPFWLGAIDRIQCIDEQWFFSSLTPKFRAKLWPVFWDITELCNGFSDYFEPCWLQRINGPGFCSSNIWNYWRLSFLPQNLMPIRNFLPGYYEAQHRGFLTVLNLSSWKWPTENQHQRIGIFQFEYRYKVDGCFHFRFQNLVSDWDLFFGISRRFASGFPTALNLSG